MPADAARWQAHTCCKMASGTGNAGSQAGDINLAADTHCAKVGVTATGIDASRDGREPPRFA
jgi:hypothetical protein